MTALVRSDVNAPINQAIQRREQVLALPLVSQPVTSTTPPSENVSSSSAPPSSPPLDAALSPTLHSANTASSSSPDSPTASSLPPKSTPPSSSASNPGTTPSPSIPPLSKSQEIAQSVLAARAAGSSFTSSITSIFGDGSAAKSGANANPLLGSAGGGKENPIHVTISERMLRTPLFLGTGVDFVR